MIRSIYAGTHASLVCLQGNPTGFSTTQPPVALLAMQPNRFPSPRFSKIIQSEDHFSQKAQICGCQEIKRYIFKFRRPGVKLF